VSTLQLLLVCLTVLLLARTVIAGHVGGRQSALLAEGERYALYLGDGEQQVTGLVRCVNGGVAELSDVAVVTAGRSQPLGRGHVQIPLSHVLMSQELERDGAPRLVEARQSA
jgi:hypothetical protein